MVDPTEWRDLKSQWQGGAPDPALEVRVRWSLTWRIWLSRAWLASELLCFVLLGLIIAQKVALAQFAAAAGLAVMAGFCVAGWLWARSGRRLGNMDSLTGMVDLALSRARTSLRMVYGTYAVILILLASIFIGVRPPAEQLAGKLAWLGISAVVTVVVHLFARARIRRFRSIRELLGSKQ